MAKVRLKRACEAPDPGDGHRVLADRLWPRGAAKDEARNQAVAPAALLGPDR